MIQPFRQLVGVAFVYIGTVGLIGHGVEKTASYLSAWPRSRTCLEVTGKVIQTVSLTFVFLACLYRPFILYPLLTVTLLTPIAAGFAKHLLENGKVKRGLLSADCLLSTAKKIGTIAFLSLGAFILIS